MRPETLNLIYDMKQACDLIRQFIEGIQGYKNAVAYTMYVNYYIFRGFIY